ncbi:uncharacterized protein LOC129756682 [Uranotaenia lowii]|uniref:uncharacterized protein LOC129756682 n=1 Tax=Uranotaenia lowii TaxID=190385 RepID=UPI00247A34C6|nr:uncharacterized protein LOC129756682 [Uranotaenia lowii]XP_055609608.1 uncharacterized protein LOC129756682 [Uranotaenia lowii]XP_055609620.1 uncharacterized protein LOC129756682 [Uranotaenia lowii]XP_055609630.1 uncharacterized protein LOC129756682 [Uranotaenia lowii]XP_055609633.1 uncharacterized protein LOC129756682 [Uranotaenia lowii]XP_055609642.1 uncharacterized protein LOC129756682 [Uranotaenia lowii]XP_055609652.1 uncharacterized protein LOC129756682 [Uranotaenia lowii]
MKHLSLLTAGLGYIPAGLTFGYLLLLPLLPHQVFQEAYQETMFWPFIVTIITLLVSVALTNGLKLNYRKCQFVHFYLQLAADVFYLAAGLVFLLVTDVIPAIYLSACGLGLTLIPGVSYVHIRAPGKWRALYMGLCTFWFIVGIASTATILLSDVQNWQHDAEILETLHTNLAICMMATAVFSILLVAVNEMLQRESIVDYKKPLDFDTDIAHESGKLMSRSERRNLFNNFTSTVTPTTNGGFPKQWNSSSEQIVINPTNTGSNYHVLWVVCMIFTKLQGFIAFYFVLIMFSNGYVMAMFEDLDSAYSTYWFMALGSLIGLICMLFMSPKITFVAMSMLHTIGLILAVAFYSAGFQNLEMGAAYIIFYTFIGASLAIPAINILELSPLNFNESFLAIGTILEIIGIALMQYFVITDSRLLGKDPDSLELLPNFTGIIQGHYIALIVLSVIIQIIVLWHMPNTYKRSLAEINSDLMRMKSYFAFSRTMEPIVNHQVPVNRNFAASVTSDHPEDVEEKQLSTRNGRVAVIYNERSDDSSDRRSSYNDFAEMRHNNRDDPYHQEQLQRQHERNYIISRQSRLQQQTRESPESQRYSNRGGDRISENRYQQRYHPDFDDYPQDRPGSRNSQQPSRYSQAPPLLSRHQYYEQYGQEQRNLPPPVQPKPVAVPPPTQMKPALRRSEISQTVKSEPGYVPRPKLQTQKSEAPAPPPLPPADYLTKSLPRIKPDQKHRDSIHPVLIPRPAKQHEEEVVPGVEYTSNLRPSEFLRQSRYSAAPLFRNSLAGSGMS